MGSCSPGKILAGDACRSDLENNIALSSEVCRECVDEKRLASACRSVDEEYSALRWVFLALIDDAVERIRLLLCEAADAPPCIVAKVLEGGILSSPSVDRPLSRAEEMFRGCRKLVVFKLFPMGPQLMPDEGQRLIGRGYRAVSVACNEVGHERAFNLRVFPHAISRCAIKEEPDEILDSSGVTEHKGAHVQECCGVFAVIVHHTISPGDLLKLGVKVSIDGTEGIIVGEGYLAQELAHVEFFVVFARYGEEPGGNVILSWFDYGAACIGGRIDPRGFILPMAQVRTIGNITACVDGVLIVELQDRESHPSSARRYVPLLPG